MRNIDEQYKLIPMDEITPEARRIAVAWIENYVPHGSIMPEIAQKQKLASDIMNYASLQCAEMKKENERLKAGLEKIVAFDPEGKDMKWAQIVAHIQTLAHVTLNPANHDTINKP